MIKFGYAAQQEQHHPLALLSHARLAEKAGFDSIWSSDHFHPWADKDAHSAFAWIWLASAAERTSKVSLGTTVTSPILRYNPALVAQAFATLAVLYPNRIFLGLGTGEAMNEVPIGYNWPPFKERLARLEEAIRIIRALWTQSRVNFKGKYYSLRKANLYTKPEKPPPLYVAASGRRTSRVAGKLADGLLTLPAGQISNMNKADFYRDVIFQGLEEGAREAGRDVSRVDRAIAITSSYDEDYDRALESLRFWGGTLLPAFFDLGISDPRVIEEHGLKVGKDAFEKAWLIATSPEDIVKSIEEYIHLGFSNIVLISSSPSQDKYIDVVGSKVLPYFRKTLK